MRVQRAVLTGIKYEWLEGFLKGNYTVFAYMYFQTNKSILKEKNSTRQKEERCEVKSNVWFSYTRRVNKK